MSMCRVFSCVVGRGCLLWPVHSHGKTLLVFALLHSVFQGQICLLLQVFLSKRTTGLPWQLSWQRIRLQCRRPRFDSWVGKIPWRRERLSTPVFWPREFHGQSMGSQRVGQDWATFTFKGTTAMYTTVYHSTDFFLFLVNPYIFKKWATGWFIVNSLVQRKIHILPQKLHSLIWHLKVTAHLRHHEVIALARQPRLQAWVPLVIPAEVFRRDRRRKAGPGRNLIMEIALNCP